MDTNQDDTEKRRWLASLESMRGSNPPVMPQASHADDHPPETSSAIHSGSSHPAASEPNTVPADPLAAEVMKVREALRVSNATCDLLGTEIEKMERKALNAIAEAGRLRQRLERLREGNTRVSENAHRDNAPPESPPAPVPADAVQNLLTEALCDSEREIARLTQALELIGRKVEIS